MTPNPCQLAVGLTAAACIALSASPARAAEDADHAESPAERVEEEARRERMADAQERLAAAVKDLAGAWKTRLRERPADRAFLGVLIAGQDEHGIRVGGLSPGGGAEEAGLMAEDVIVAINGESLLGDRRPVRRLQRALGEAAPGAIVALAVTRDGKELEFDVVTTPSVSVRWLDDLFDHEWMAEMADMRAWARPRRSLRGDGLEFVDIGEDLGAYFGVDAGVLVLDTPADSPLKPGDIVRRIAGAAVSSAEDAYRLRRRLEDEADVEVRRKNRNVTVVLTPGPTRERPRPPLRKRAVIVVDPNEETVYEVDEEVELEAE